jgi:septum formation protein
VKLVLASSSPRRIELLRAAGFEFEVAVASIDETPLPGEPAEAYVRRLATAKARHVQAALGTSSGDAAILGADTTVVVGQQILGKPGDEQEAASMLRSLAGRRHEVLTGVTVCRGDREVGSVERTAVLVAPLTEDEISWYVRSGEGLDKAGGYAVQGLASRFVTGIEGSYSNVVGLPVAVVHTLLRELMGPGADA